MTAADPQEQKRADKRKAAWLAKKPNRGYQFAAGERRKGHPANMDRPQTAHQPGFESTGADGAGSNSVGVDTSVTSRNTVRMGKYGVAD